jgi:glucose/arabinose dehydrogenase
MRGPFVFAGVTLVALLLLVAGDTAMRATPRQAGGTVTFADYREQRPGVRHRITVQNLPKPYATPSAEEGPDIVARPKDAWPQAPPNFRVSLYATGLENPRLVRRAPNGDLFVSESQPGRIRVLRGLGGDGRAATANVFATGLRRPFGIAFYPPGPNPQFVYIADTDEVLRFPYSNGDLQARGERMSIAALPGGGRLRGGGHWTRDIAFSRDGRRMFVSVGSFSNVDDVDGNEREHHRANILEFTPDGKGPRVFASGIRNAVGIAVSPETGDLWASVNERDELGDNLVPDYITRVQEGGFYGWPWFYMGGFQDPRHAGKHPELKDKVLTPDVLVQPHAASLGMVFYEGNAFPAPHRGVFAAQHGSWNRAARTGYEVIHVPLRDGRATGEYEDFLTGFVTSSGKVWGRPVGVAVASDGSLIVTDDGSDSVWRVTYAQGRAEALPHR